MDALLGAAALGDIGQHFPDTDPEYLGADSMMLLGKVRALLKDVLAEDKVELEEAQRIKEMLEDLPDE